MTTKPHAFVDIAKRAFRERLPGSEWGRGEWTGKSNVAWALVRLDERFVGYFIVQRTHRVRITGELAFSHGLHNPGFFGPAQQKDEPYGARLRIGRLLGTGDTWWPCSEEPDRLRNELGELIELLRAHAEAFFRTCKVHALARMS